MSSHLDKTTPPGPLCGPDKYHKTSTRSGSGLATSTCSLWIHRGAGHYMGSLVIVCAENKTDAETIIREQLDKSGLRDEPLEVTEAMFSKNSVIVCNDGDY